MAFARLTRKTTNETPIHVNPDNVVCVEPIHNGGTMVTSAVSKGDGVYIFSVAEDLDTVTGLLEQAQRR